MKTTVKRQEVTTALGLIVLEDRSDGTLRITIPEGLTLYTYQTRPYGKEHGAQRPHIWLGK